MNLLIKDGNVFLDGKFKKHDLIVKGSKISGKVDSLASDMILIDAKDKFVLPGLIDIHVHFRDFGEEYKEDWNTASRAASSGGITTVFDMPNNLRPVLNKKELELKSAAVKKKSIVNYGLYVAATDDNIKEINGSKIKLVKLYYGMTTGKIAVKDAKKIFRELNKDILVVVHAEDNSLIEANAKSIDKNAYGYHSLVRSRDSEVKAVRDIINLAKEYKTRIHFTHISTIDSVELIKKAKSDNLNVTCDTCPHYLFLDDLAYSKLKNRAKVNPPLRSRLDKEMLWKYLNDGDIDCLCSDHAPHTSNEKTLDYELCPAGFPGVETTLRLMLTAVNQGKIDLETFIRLMSENPAKVFGISKKGRLNPGYDADITIVDLNKDFVIDATNLQTKAGWSPFEGFKNRGDVLYTIVNGNIVYDGLKRSFNDEIKGREVTLL